MENPNETERAIIARKLYTIASELRKTKTEGVKKILALQGDIFDKKINKFRRTAFDFWLRAGGRGHKYFLSSLKLIPTRRFLSFPNARLMDLK